MSETIRCPQCQGILSGQAEHTADMPCTCWMIEEAKIIQALLKDALFAEPIVAEPCGNNVGATLQKENMMENERQDSVIDTHRRAQESQLRIRLMQIMREALAPIKDFKSHTDILDILSVAISEKLINDKPADTKHTEIAYQEKVQMLEGLAAWFERLSNTISELGLYTHPASVSSALKEIADILRPRHKYDMIADAFRTYTSAELMKYIQKDTREALNKYFVSRGINLQMRPDVYDELLDDLSLSMVDVFINTSARTLRAGQTIKKEIIPLKLIWKMRYVPEGQLTPDKHKRWACDCYCEVNPSVLIDQYPGLEGIESKVHVRLATIELTNTKQRALSNMGGGPEYRFMAQIPSLEEPLNGGMGFQWYYSKDLQELKNIIEAQLNRLVQIITT